MKKKVIYPPEYFFTAILLMVLIHNTFPLYELIDYPQTYSGILFICIGLAINFWASNYFKKIKTTTYPFQESFALAKKGMFKISRNPMYLGMLLFLVGLGIFCGSLTPFIIVALFGFLINYRFIKKEEEMLELKFGDQYIAYKNEVRRWL